MDTYDNIELETTDNHVVQSSSNIYTDDPLPTSSESQPPAHEWTNPDLVINNTSTSADGPHAFDQRIMPITWAYQ